LIPFDSINAAALSALPSLLADWFPRGKIVGKEFLIGDLQGNAGESLSINIRTGRWGDFNGGVEKGGDPISLAAALFHNGDRVAAAKDLGKRLGVYVNGTAGAAPSPLLKADKPENDWRDFFPPEDAPAPDLSGWDHAYVYRSGDGFIRRYVVRKDARGTERKKIMPLTYGILNGKEGWHHRHPLPPRSLYGIDRLYEMPNVAVIVCEGEKAADAAQLLFPRSPCVTWTAGTGNVNKTDWSPLEGRRVIIWPDNDEPGIKAAKEITEILSGIASKVGTIRVDDLPEKADAADVTIDNPVNWLKARLSWAEPGAGDGGPSRRQAALEVIQVKAGEIDVTADAGEAALIAADMPVYQRGGYLVRPGKREVTASSGRTILAAGLSEITLPSMIDLLCQAVAWEKWDARSDEWVPCNPPGLAAQVILARGGQWNFKSIAGVITTPTLRPDGSVLSKPGYDAATRLFYLPDPSLRLDANRLPTSRAHAEDAIEELEGLLSGFPMVGAVDKSVVLSAMITPVVRGIMSVSPLHAFRAATAGSGKSYLADVASAISAGRPCPVVSAGYTEEETEKRLVGLLLGGYPLLSLDNVNGELGGDLLCQAAERPLLRVRELGKSGLIEIENRATIFANGNNMRIRGDMTRRTLLANLDAGVERPELRKFDFDPVETVLADRKLYVAAALTIVRSFLLSDEKVALSPIASFEDWSRTVRAAIVWLGRADPCNSMEEARDDDPVLIDLREVLVHASSAVGVKRQFMVREIVEISNQFTFNNEGDPVKTYPDLRESLMRVAGNKNEINTRSLGRWLSSNEGRIAEGLRFRRAKEWSGGVHWEIERVSER
jgi:putative DNA primase/helicase